MLSRIFEVFTKEYRKETNYREIAFKMCHNFRLKDISESVEDKIRRLSDKKFVSEFKITVGDY